MAAISVNLNSISRPVSNYNSAPAFPVPAEATLLQSAPVRSAEPAEAESEPANDFIRVSSSIGRAASAGQLSRQEAVDIYRQIASFL